MYVTVGSVAYVQIDQIILQLCLELRIGCLQIALLLFEAGYIDGDIVDTSPERLHLRQCGYFVLR